VSGNNIFGGNNTTGSYLSNLILRKTDAVVTISSTTLANTKNLKIYVP